MEQDRLGQWCVSAGAPPPSRWSSTTSTPTDTRRLYYKPSLYIPDSQQEEETGKKGQNPTRHLVFHDCVHWVSLPPPPPLARPPAPLAAPHSQFLVGHHRFPKEEVTELAALLWFIFRGAPGTPGTERDVFSANFKFMVPAYAVKRMVASTPASKTAVVGSDSPWSSSNCTKDAPHPVTGKVPHMRLHLSDEATQEDTLAHLSWNKFTGLKFPSREAAEMDFIEQSKEYIPFGADFFLSRVRRSDATQQPRLAPPHPSHSTPTRTEPPRTLTPLCGSAPLMFWCPLGTRASTSCP